MREDADDHQQLLRRVALHERKERGVQHVWTFDLVRVLAQEEHTFIDQLADDETQDLAQIATGDQFLSWHPRSEGHDVTGDVTWAYLKGLLAGLVRRFIYNLIVLRPWKVFVFERIKRALVKK